MNVTLQDLLKAGVHFGHRTSRWNPAMDEFIYARREGLHVIDLQQTLERLETALDFVKKHVSKGDSVLFVGTKKQAKDAVKKAAEDCGMPYVSERWLGGTFTNYSIVKKQVDKLKKLEEQREKGDLEKYTKKEQLMFAREIERLEKNVGGLKKMDKLPAAVIMVDINAEKNAVKEIQNKNIPLIALVDTNVNPKEVDFPVPANDDAIKAIELLLNEFADTISKNYSAPVAEEPKKDAKAAKPKKEIKKDSAKKSDK